VRARHTASAAEGAGLAATEVLRRLSARLGRRHLDRWGDLYGARVSGQELDVTSLAEGAYCLVSRADPENRLQESNERNNIRTTRIELRGDRVGWRSHRPC